MRDKCACQVSGLCTLREPSPVLCIQAALLPGLPANTPVSARSGWTLTHCLQEALRVILGHSRASSLYSTSIIRSSSFFLPWLPGGSAMYLLREQPRATTAWFKVCFLIHPSVTLGKSPNLSVSQVSHLQNTTNHTFHVRGVVMRIKGVNRNICCFWDSKGSPIVYLIFISYQIFLKEYIFICIKCDIQYVVSYHQYATLSNSLCFRAVYPSEEYIQLKSKLFEGRD